MSNNIRTVTNFEMQPIQILPQTIQDVTFEQDHDKQLINLELERKQSMGRTYAGMLPTR
jgi:hypothetical protein